MRVDFFFFSKIDLYTKSGTEEKYLSEWEFVFNFLSLPNSILNRQSKIDILNRRVNNFFFF